MVSCATQSPVRRMDVLHESTSKKKKGLESRKNCMKRKREAYKCCRVSEIPDKGHTV